MPAERGSHRAGRKAQALCFFAGANSIFFEDKVLTVEAREAKAAGAGRFCMGAAWKGVREGEAKFESVLNIVRDVKELGYDGGLTPPLKEAWATAPAEI